MRSPTILSKVLLAILCLGMIASAWARETSAVRALMEESGLVRQSAGLDQAFRKMVVDAAKDLPELPPEHLESLADISADIVTTERYLADVERALTGILTEKQIAAMREFYASPLGQSALRAEIAGASQEMVDEIDSTGEALRAQARRDSERTALMRRLDEQFTYSEGSVYWFQMADEIVASAALEAQFPNTPPEDFATLRSRIAGQRDSLVEAMREQATASFTRIYRDLSTSELKAYAEFLEAGPAAEFYAAYHVANRQIIERCVEEIQTRFEKYVRQKKA